MDLPDTFHGMESISNKGPYNFHTMDFHTVDNAVGPLKLPVYTTLNFCTTWIKQATVPSVLFVRGPCIAKQVAPDG